MSKVYKRGVQYSHYTGTDRQNICSYARTLRHSANFSDAEFSERYGTTRKEVYKKLSESVDSLTETISKLDNLNGYE